MVSVCELLVGNPLQPNKELEAAPAVIRKLSDRGGERVPVLLGPFMPVGMARPVHRKVLVQRQKQAIPLQHLAVQLPKFLEGLPARPVRRCATGFRLEPHNPEIIYEVCDGPGSLDRFRGGIS